jgi:hypothetical protein
MTGQIAGLFRGARIVEVGSHSSRALRPIGLCRLGVSPEDRVRFHRLASYPEETTDTSYEISGRSLRGYAFKNAAAALKI